MNPKAKPVDKPVVPILLEKLRAGSEAERAFAADILTAINPSYSELPSLLTELTEVGRRITSGECSHLHHEVPDTARRFVELVGSEAVEAIPILIRDVVDNRCPSGDLDVFGPVACRELLQAIGAYCDDNEDGRARSLLSEIEGVVRQHPACVTPPLIRSISRILECWKGHGARDAACGVLGACAGQSAALFAVPALLIYHQEVRGLGLEESVDAARDALEAIAPDAPDVREELDSVDER